MIGAGACVAWLISSSYTLSSASASSRAAAFPCSSTASWPPNTKWWCSASVQLHLHRRRCGYSGGERIKVRDAACWMNGSSSSMQGSCRIGGERAERDDGSVLTLNRMLLMISATRPQPLNDIRAVCGSEKRRSSTPSTARLRSGTLSVMRSLRLCSCRRELRGIRPIADQGGQAGVPARHRRKARSTGRADEVEVWCQGHRLPRRGRCRGCCSRAS